MGCPCSKGKSGTEKAGVLCQSLLKLKDSKTAMAYHQIKAKMDELISIDNVTGMQKLVDEFNETVSKWEEDVDLKKDLYTPPTARYQNVPVRKNTQVVLDGRKTDEEARKLHMNKFVDFYGYDLLLSQAPVPNVFADQFDAIWQQKVGLVVWVGDLVEDNVQKLEPYIELTKGKMCRWGQYEATTTEVDKSKYDRYEVKLKKTDADDSRQIIFMHLHNWPDSNIPRQPALLADAITDMQRHQTSQNEKGLPAILVHCSAGVQRSPALLAIYIGRQMYSHCGKVDVMGILEHVRRHRYLAWAVAVEKAFCQFQLVFGVLEIFGLRTKMEKDGQGKPTSSMERAVFDKKSRSGKAMPKAPRK